MIYLIGGARPNFMKIAAISRAFEKFDIEYEIVHTGQHYDYNMNKVFFEEFGLREPLVHLDTSPGNHGEQTAQIMTNLERFFMDSKPDMVFTVGDVNSTMAAALVGAKMHIPVAHQEAGMRSGDKKMPEEINRIVTDHVSDLLFPISPQDKRNLYNEGISPDITHLVGDPMIDNLLYYTNQIEEPEIKNPYILVELHRPANVDNKENLREILIALNMLRQYIHVIFPLHPRTKKMIDNFCFWDHLVNLDFREPMGYFEFIKYMKNAKVMITDSDGIQQETSVLDIPCVSIRDTTNIEYTVTWGTNALVEAKHETIFEVAGQAMGNDYTFHSFKNNFTDQLKLLNNGQASERIAGVIKS